MERPVMFVQSLLVLMVAIQAISACQCPQRTMKQIMCDDETVFMAAAVSEEYTDAKLDPVAKCTRPTFRKYKMFVHTIYKEGPIPVGDKDHIEIVTPFLAKDCGVVLEIGVEYHLSGDLAVDSGILFVSNCSLVHRVPWFDVPREEYHATNDILTGQRKPQCNEEICYVILNGRIVRC